MKYILQVDFPYAGPWGEEMAEAMRGLAQSIAQEKGLVWKIWTEDREGGRSGGVYLFETREDAQAYMTMHTARLASFGIPSELIEAKVFAVNETLSAIDRFTC